MKLSGCGFVSIVGFGRWIEPSASLATVEGGVVVAGVDVDVGSAFLIHTNEELTITPLEFRHASMAHWPSAYLIGSKPGMVSPPRSTNVQVSDEPPDPPGAPGLEPPEEVVDPDAVTVTVLPPSVPVTAAAAADPMAIAANTAKAPIARRFDVLT